MEFRSTPPDHQEPDPLSKDAPLRPVGSVMFPSLPILADVGPRLSQREKYGSLFYLGLLGLAVATALVVWFAVGTWQMRDVWSHVYVLHDSSRTDADRVRAALALSRDPRVNQRQRWDICLRKPLPTQARYLIAESLTGEAATSDPSGYAWLVARSPDWPDWLRVLLMRPMAYAAIDGVKFPRPALEELQSHTDRAVVFWASFVLALELHGEKDPSASMILQHGCEETTKDRALACLLLEAERSELRPAEARRLLDRATSWLRGNHPSCKTIWDHTAEPVPQASQTGAMQK